MKITEATKKLADFVTSHPNLLVITGAGCSAASGIPTYRNEAGAWQHSEPIQHQAFVEDPVARQRYWTRSLAGWPTVCSARPNEAHKALRALEEQSICRLLVTQNVDRLHQRAGHRKVIDLHGRLDQVICMGCRHVYQRQQIQERIQQLNPAFDSSLLRLLPDGDSEPACHADEPLRVPDCERCNGLLKPNVVFYGGTVDRDLVQSIYAVLDDMDGVLVVGSSLMVFSSFRFCKRAQKSGVPIVAINKGITRADEMLSFKVHENCQDCLQQLVHNL